MPGAGVPDPGREPAARLTWEQVRAWRVRRHHLDARVPRRAMLDVIADICGIHAQLMTSAAQTLWARVDDVEPQTVERALWEERTLVKTWALRGTLHLLPSSEYALWQAYLGRYRHYLKGSWLKSFGFTRAELERTLDAVGEALDGRTLTREELAAEVASLTGSAKLRDRLLDSWGATLKPAAFRGLLCYAPDEGQNVRFTRPDRWLDEQPEVDPEEASREVVRRYLRAYGPATREHFGRWGGLGAAEAGRRIDALGDELVQVDLAGTRMWMLRDDVGDAQEASPTGSVRLLPRFDPYIVGAPRDEPGIVPDEFKDRVYRASGWIWAVLLVDGEAAGVWDSEVKGDRVEIEIEPFRRLPGWAREAAAAEAEKLAEFLGATLDLSWKATR